MLRTTVPEISIAHSLINQDTCGLILPNVETLYKRPQIRIPVICAVQVIRSAAISGFSSVALAFGFS